MRKLSNEIRDTCNEIGKHSKQIRETPDEISNKNRELRNEIRETCNETI